MDLFCIVVFHGKTKQLTVIQEHFLRLIQAESGIVHLIAGRSYSPVTPVIRMLVRINDTNKTVSLNCKSRFYKNALNVSTISK